jgi:hypothetical protein
MISEVVVALLGNEEKKVGEGEIGSTRTGMLVLVVVHGHFSSTVACI